MWNFVNTMGHPGHLTSPFAMQKRDFSLNIQNVPIIPGKTFTNPNFVNKHHPSVHSYKNSFILTPIQKISHTDSANVNNKPHHTNAGLINSSQSIIEKVKENQIDVIKSVEPNCQKEIVKDPVMCSSRKRSNRNRRHKRGKAPGKNSKQNISRQQINEMMDVDLELEPSANALDISMSPKIQCNSFNLTDFIVEKTNKTKPIKIEHSWCDSDEEESVFTTEISYSPSIGKLCMRDRQLSITESEDSFIIFDNATDEELEFSEDAKDESDDEKGEDEVDSSLSVIPHKRVRFAIGTELCEIHPMVQWSFAYQQARKGHWEEYARDRERFGNRITEAEKIIAPVFDPQHRENVYKTRFKGKDVAF